MADLNAILDEFEDDLLSVTRLSCAFITASVVDETPVLRGSLQASWNPSLDGPETRNVNVDQGDRYRPDYSRVINKIEIGDSYHLSNGQPYAPLVEFTDHSAKGSHMMEQALARWQEFVDDAVKDTR